MIRISLGQQDCAVTWGEEVFPPRYLILSVLVVGMSVYMLSCGFICVFVLLACLWPFTYSLLCRCSSYAAGFLPFPFYPVFSPIALLLEGLSQ